MHEAMKIAAGWLKDEDIRLDVDAASKTSVLDAVARVLAARQGLDAKEVFDALWHRERLGSTGLGHGVALPHARVAGLGRPVAAFMRLKQAIPFDAPDDVPVDLVVGLLLPREQSQKPLQLLAHIAELLSDVHRRARVRQAADAQSVARELAHAGAA